MTVLTCANTGKSITLLGEPIVNSGKGKVLRTNHNGYLAKFTTGKLLSECKSHYLSIVVW
ncbi:hypothetical protein [Nostoc sp.]|uniref:hypothetical protein n=1 Tax=Nostoc sp. TaxID=1180 RepID=UPI002FFA0303